MVSCAILNMKILISLNLYALFLQGGSGSEFFDQSICFEHLSKSPMHNYFYHHSNYKIIHFIYKNVSVIHQSNLHIA